MPEYKWPEPGTTALLGKRLNRLDGPAKVRGDAKYAYDLKRPGMLYAKMLRCPYAHAKIVSIDTSEAERLPGVAAVHIVQGPGTEIHWADDDLVAVAAVDEGTAEDAIRRIKIEYEKLPHFVNEHDLSKVGDRGRSAAEQVVGDPDKAFQDPDVVAIEGEYGTSVVTHCALESHGQVVEWDGENVTVYPSTQGVERYVNQFAEALKVPAANVRGLMQYMGGGFGAKFTVDRWGIACAQLAKKAGKPVKLMLERKEEVEVAGCRPSAYTRVKLAAKRDGTLVAWQSETWGTSGPAGGGSPPLPYVWTIPNQRKRYILVPTNNGPARAWRSPNHPQACYLTMCPFEDLAAKLGMDPFDLVMKNISLLGERAELYRRELLKAEELMEWKKKWHPRGDRTPGPIKRGVGLALHTWGGRGHDSSCEVTIHPDGSVEVNICTQDLGTGTRTAVAMIAAETLGLPLEAIKLNIGDTRLPDSGSSGGSTTIGGVSAATRRAALMAAEQLFNKVAPSLGASADQLEAVGGQVRVKGDSSKSLAWKQATAKLGVAPIRELGKQPGPGELNSSGVCGVQMAEVSVDVETGIIKVAKMVAIQDCGLIISMKTAESQVYGSLIMGISTALFEERVVDSVTGRMLNANMEFYKLAGLADVGELVVHMVTDADQQRRGPIGLGEPPMNSPAAAIANAVANAIGVRVPTLPLTPDKVLAALEKGGMA